MPRRNPIRQYRQLTVDSSAVPVPQTYGKLRHQFAFQTVKPRRFRTDLKMAAQVKIIAKHRREQITVADLQAYETTTASKIHHVHFLRALLNEIAVYHHIQRRRLAQAQESTQPQQKSPNPTLRRRSNSFTSNRIPMNRPRGNSVTRQPVIDDTVLKELRELRADLREAANEVEDQYPVFLQRVAAKRLFSTCAMMCPAK